MSAAKDENAGEIVCLLDAIDECEDHGRSQLTQALCKLYGTRSNFNLKFLLTMIVGPMVKFGVVSSFWSFQGCPSFTCVGKAMLR
jgi:hypothetical protein